MKHKFPALDGVRGLAVLLVLVAHSADIAFHGTRAYPYTSQIATHLAWAGMTLFFVLSGVVITAGYHNLPQFSWRSFALFFGARFARLYPLYFTTIFLYGGYHWLFRKFVIGLLYFTLTQSWFDQQLRFFPPVWSISTEFFFYVIFYVALLPAGKLLKACYLKFNSSEGILVIFWLLCVLLGIAVHDLTCHRMSDVGAVLHVDNTQGWISYYSPFFRIYEFIAGYALAIYMAYRPNSDRGDFIIILCGCVLSFALGVWSWFDPLFGNYITQNYLFAPFFCSLILAAVKRTSVSRIFCSSFMIFTGQISYSLYLLQFAVMTVASTLIPEGKGFGAHNLVKFACIILFSYAFAYGSYLLIELPTQRIIRAWFSRITARDPAPT